MTYNPYSYNSPTPDYRDVQKSQLSGTNQQGYTSGALGSLSDYANKLKETAQLETISGLQQTQHPCPSCGYCPHCGRGGNYTPYPTYPSPYTITCTDDLQQGQAIC